MFHNKKCNLLNFAKVSQEPPLSEIAKFELIILFLKVEWIPLIEPKVVDIIFVSVILNFSLFILNSALMPFAEVKTFSLLIIASSAWT